MFFKFFMGRDFQLAKDVLSEFLHNLLLCALSKKNINVELKFNSITKVMKEIDRNCKSKAIENKKKTQEALKYQEKPFEKM